MAQTSTPAKTAKATPPKADKPAETTSQPAETTFADPIPFTDPIQRNMAATVVRARNEISSYNEEVLSKSDDDSWTPTKLVAQAKTWARPDDASKEVDSSANELLKTMELAQDAVNKAKMQLAEYAAKKLNVDMTSDRGKRDEVKEEELKGLRVKAVGIVKLLQQSAEYAPRQEDKDVIFGFLAANDIPQIGREGTFRITDDSVGTPKYRVDVKAEKDGKVLFEEKGFTKASLSAKKHHAKDKSPNREHLQKLWEDAGNKPGETKQSKVSAEYDGVTYTISSR